MANTLKNKKAAPPPPEIIPSQASDLVPIVIDKKRQVRLGFGIFFLLTGIFTCLAIVSYCFTWSIDQDKLMNEKGLSYFLFHDHSPVVNMCGRLGATIAHLLVYRGAGIASLAIGIAVAGLGINLIYGKRALPILRYLRWVSTTLLLLAPVLTFCFEHSAFPLGGALGKNAIEYFNGLLGKLGTGMALLSTVLFFIFVIFALDLRPFLNRMKKHAEKVAANLTPEPVFNAPESTEHTDHIDANTPPFPMDNGANQLKNDNGNTTLVIDDSRNDKKWNMPLEERAAPEPELTEELEEEEYVDEPETEEEEEYSKFLEEKNAALNEEKAPEDLELSYVVKQVNEPQIKHGDHISIADNEPFAPEESLRDYKFPTLDLLEDRVQEAISLNKEELETNKNQILNTLRSFGIEIKTITATVGPTVTLYEVVPAEGVRISKIRNLEDDIALNLAALGIRIIAPIPGKGTIGIEVPNANKQIVSMRALLSSEKFVNNKMSLPIALGKKIDNENYIVDLATMPHLLMAGATGQGKSVGINAILVSLLYKKHPSQLKFVMVDPKKVELSIYRKIEKHFLAKLPNETEPIITDTKKAIYTLKALCDEMDNRYELLKEAGARNIKEYNEKIVNRRIKNPAEHKYLPFIVLVIDEFADLIMTAGKEVEMPIARLAQLARAVGIHLIIATQRPSVNVITGTIKANFPARIAFKVSAKVDSRTILDAGGAEQLIGRGDMLVSHGSELLRLQCAFVDTPEVEEIVNFIGDQRGYPSAHHLPEPEMDDEEGGAKVDLKNRDKLFEDCSRLVVQMQSGSTSNLQRRLNLGYNRAGRIMDQLEAAGIVGAANGSKAREVYFRTESELEEHLSTMG
ncbi:MAG: cell division protein FtsK [Flavipsychrobacter sp.]|nr:cell division protein FtsK [Flavipsychrobacter sp.]